MTSAIDAALASAAAAHPSNLSWEEYVALDAINFSTAKYLLKSPEHFLAAREQPEEEEELKNSVGTLTHAMILEGKDLRGTFAIKPVGMKFNTREGRAWKEAQTKPILRAEDANKVPRMAEAIARHPTAPEVIRCCPEREHVVQARLGGLPAKGRLDAVGFDADGARGFLDLKTCGDASKEGFRSQVMTLHYDMQMEWYAYLLAMAEHLGDPPWSTWIAVETSPPYAVALYTPTELMQESGREKIARALETFHAAKDSGNWYAYHRDIMELDPPNWRIAQLEMAA